MLKVGTSYSHLSSHGEFFIATLAYQIAIFIPATRQYIERAVEEDEGLCIMYVDPSRRPPLKMFTNHIEHNQVHDKLKKLQSGSKLVETICSSVDSQGPLQVASQPTADDLYEILYNDILLPYEMTLAAV